VVLLTPTATINWDSFDGSSRGKGRGGKHPALDMCLVLGDKWAPNGKKKKTKRKKKDPTSQRRKKGKKKKKKRPRG